jgi:hypothetical protein
MKHQQKGEVAVVVIVMIAMMAWMMNRGMGMMGMGHGGVYTEQSAHAEPQTKDEPTQPSAPKETPEHKH